MNMFYIENTLYVNLKGDVDMKKVEERLFSVLDKYNINNVKININEVFNYKRKDYDGLINDYTRIYKGKINIEKKRIFS